MMNGPSLERPRPPRLARTLALFALAMPTGTAALRGDDRHRPPIEAYEWSVWVGSPSQTTLNATRLYRNAMPSSVGTLRPSVEEGADTRFPLAPISVVQAFGEPTKDIDFDLRVKKGTVLAHWPGGTERSDGLRWFKSDLLAKTPSDIAPGYLPDDHWMQSLRKADPALYIKHETRADRFLAYDTELNLPIPVKIRGGPGEYTLQNLTDRPLLDVAVIAPVEAGGYRVGWIDELPSGVPIDDSAEKADKEKKEKDKDGPDAIAKAAEAALDAAEADSKKGKGGDEPKPRPLPAEGDANVRARVDQALNRSVTVDVDKVPRRDALDLIATQARFRYEVDAPSLAKDKVDLGQLMTMKAGTLAARDALAEVVGAVGLSYRIAEDGSLFITTSARLAAETNRKARIEGPPVKLTLSQPLKGSDPSYRELTRDAYARRLGKQGMRREVLSTYLDQYAAALFEPKGMVVLTHLSRDAIDEAVSLDVFPVPEKFVRTAVIVTHGIDPRLQDRARTLVKALGDTSPRAREDAETALFELGPVAVPVLEDALREKDVEIVFRAERILLRLNRQVP